MEKLNVNRNILKKKNTVKKVTENDIGSLELTDVDPDFNFDTNHVIFNIIIILCILTYCIFIIYFIYSDKIKNLTMNQNVLSIQFVLSLSTAANVKHVYQFMVCKLTHVSDSEEILKHHLSSLLRALWCP